MPRRPDPDILRARFPEDWWVPPNAPWPEGTPAFTRVTWERVRDLAPGVRFKVDVAAFTGGRALWSVERAAGGGYHFVGGGLDVVPLPEIFAPAMDRETVRAALDYLFPALGEPASIAWVSAFTGVPAPLLRALARAKHTSRVEHATFVVNTSAQRYPADFAELSRLWALARYDLAGARAAALPRLRARFLPARFR